MRYKKAARYVLVLALASLAPMFFPNSFSKGHAAGGYSLSPVPPGYAQEGGSVGLFLTVTGANQTIYTFRFYVQDPSSGTFHSINETYDNSVNPQYAFNVIVTYPSTAFSGRNSLLGQYQAWVDQFNPVVKTKVATSSFWFILTNKSEYQRTETVNIQGSGYNSSEPVTVTIRLASSSTPFYSTTIRASAGGLVITSWKIPRNATIAYYVVTLSGSTTIKNPADLQAFLVGPATMTVATISSSKPIYQRTETMTFSFQPVYPDGSNATTGTAVITLTNPTGAELNLTAPFDALARTFKASYKTSPVNGTGTWNATLVPTTFNDGFGNTGPTKPLTSLPQLTVANLAISASATSYVGIGQQLQLNATITYPDGTALQSGLGVGAYLLYSGSPVVNDTVQIGFDAGLQLWKGSYNLRSTDPGGIWTLYVKAYDSSSPANQGSTSKVVTTQDHPPVAGFSSSTTSAQTGSLIHFNGTASYDPDGTISTWSWTFGDGSSGLGSSTSHMFTSAGIYTVTLTATDNSGSTGSSTAQITIVDRPPTVSFTPSTTTPSSGQTVTISITASDPYGSIAQTKIDWGDGTTSTLGSASSATHSYTLTGSSSKGYTITVTVTNTSGQSASATSNVTVQPANNSSSGNVSLPLYYFGILAIAIAALLAGGFLAFRRHRVTHAKLKIDLEAVKSEAGRIENQDFFQSVKDQLKKEKDEQ